MDLNKLMQQAQKMQAELATTQEQLAAKRFTTTGAGGKIEVTVDGKGDLHDLKIDPAIVDPDDAEFLSSAVLQTIQQAVAESRAEAESAMKGLTGGLGIPGL